VSSPNCKSKPNTFFKLSEIPNVLSVSLTKSVRPIPTERNKELKILGCPELA